MICQACHGKGRVVSKVTHYVKGEPAATLDEISICTFCYGTGTTYCCDGDREQAMLEATDVNPNEAS